MSQFVPSASIDDGELAIRLDDSETTSSMKVSCVVDLTDFGDVVGVEILDLRRQLSGAVVESSHPASDIRWSYDAEIDAFYIHLMEGRGQVQVRVSATAYLDSRRRLVQLQVPMSFNR
jgi:uncharacterized protein YuzE